MMMMMIPGLKVIKIIVIILMIMRAFAGSEFWTFGSKQERKEKYIDRIEINR